MDDNLKNKSEEELLREFQWAGEHIRDQDLPAPAKDELQKILNRVEEERNT